MLHTGQPSDAVVCTNRGQEIVLWSSGAVKMFGYRSTEAVGSSLEVGVCIQETSVSTEDCMHACNSVGGGYSWGVVLVFVVD